MAFCVLWWPLLFLARGDNGCLFLSGILSLVSAFGWKTNRLLVVTLSVLFPWIVGANAFLASVVLFVLIFESIRKEGIVPHNDALFLSQVPALMLYDNIACCRVFETSASIILNMGFHTAGMFMIGYSCIKGRFDHVAYLIPACSVVMSIQGYRDTYRTVVVLCGDPKTLCVLMFWIFCLLGSWMVMCIMKSRLNQMDICPKLRLALLRKYFHVLSVLMFCPILSIHPDLLCVCLSLMMVVFVFVETARYIEAEPRKWTDALTTYLKGFLNKNHEGVISSHIYLLYGVSFPVWLYVDRNVFEIKSSGLVCLGIGDTAAAVFGNLFGKHKWSGSEKSLEGTVYATGSIMIAFYVLKSQFVIIPSIVAGLVEAFADIDDNLPLSVSIPCIQICLIRFIA